MEEANLPIEIPTKIHTEVRDEKRKKSPEMLEEPEKDTFASKIEPGVDMGV